MSEGQQRWWKRPGVLVVLALLGILVVGVVGSKVAAGLGVKRDLEAIRKRGLPTNPAELNDWYLAVPTNENAALVFIAAYRQHVEPSKGANPSDFDWRSMPLDEPLAAKVVETLEEYVGRNAATLKLLHQGAQLSRSRYPMDLSKAPDVMLPHMIGVKESTQLLRWEAVLKAERGDRRGAVQALKSGFAIAASLNEEPLLLSELVRTACLAIHLNGMERVINRLELAEEDLETLATVTRKAAEDGKRVLFRTMAGELAYARPSFEMTYLQYEQNITLGGMVPVNEEVPEIFKETLFNLRRGLGMQDRDHRFFVRSMGKLVAAAELDFPELLRESQRATVEIDAELKAHPIAYLLSKMLLPPMATGAKKEALLVARLRCMAMALEIERFRGNMGRLPRSDELMPSIFREPPLDPVDGEPLQYLEGDSGKGFRIVATGATAEENKGRSPASVRDVAFTVKR